MVFDLSALWWRRIRGSWKLPDGRDWLRAKQGIVLMGRAMLSKSLNQLSVDGRDCIPSLFFDLRLNYGAGNENNSDLLQNVPYKKCSNQCLWPCSRQLLTHTFADPHGPSWASLGQSLVESRSFLLGPDVPKVLFVPSKILFPQSCISSGGSMVGLMVTSSKKTYTIPRSTAPRAPALPAVHCWPTDDTQTQTPRQATVNPCIYGRLLDTHRLSWGMKWVWC